MSLAAISGSSVPMPIVVIGTIAALLLQWLVAYGIYRFISLPWRKRESALTVLDLIELGGRDGKSPEASLVGLFGWPEARLPLQLHLLVAYLQSGLSLADALERVPALLPRTLRELLRVGVGRVPLPHLLKVCRGSLGTPLDSRKGSLLILLILLAQFLLTSCWTLFLFQVVIAPKLAAILEDFQPAASVAQTVGMQDHTFWVSTWVLLALSALLGLFTLKCIWGNSRFSQFLDDRLDFILPWQRDRLRLNFASALGMYMDAGFSEEEALLKAASSVSNRVLESRVTSAAARLRQGERFETVLAALDESGEFQWRMRHACHGAQHSGNTGTRFLDVLQGWIEFIRLRADQVEIQWIQSLTVISLLVLGVLTGMHCWWVFKLLEIILEAAS